MKDVPGYGRLGLALVLSYLLYGLIIAFFVTAFAFFVVKTIQLAIIIGVVAAIITLCNMVK